MTLIRVSRWSQYVHVESQHGQYRDEEETLLRPLRQPSAAPSTRLKLRVDGADQDATERDAAAGEMLLELERRQDDVLLQLDELDKKLTSLLSGLGVTFVDDQESDNASIRLADLSDDSDEETPASEEESEGFSSLSRGRKAA